ncbi:MAG: hypothetical protein L0241_13195 [Planctomycetia bacterium]|nr:hypothetical protein [Planctomycetia bacterium]
MTDLCPCVCCNNPLEPAQQFRFLVETDNLGNPAFLARIRTLPTRNGKPVPVCKACQTRIESTPAKPARPQPTQALTSSLLGVFGALSLGLLLGSFLTSRS